MSAPVAHFIYSLPNPAIFFLYLVIFLIFSYGVEFAVTHYIPLEHRRQNHAVLAATSQLCNVFFALLVSFTSLYLIENYYNARDAATKEAAAITDTFHDSLALPNNLDQPLQTMLKNYTQIVISQEWPLMSTGQSVKNNGGEIIRQMNILLRNTQINNPMQLVLWKNCIDDLKLLSDTRENRIQLAKSKLLRNIWGVIILMAILTLVINRLFATEKFSPTACIIISSLVVTTAIFQITILDRPMQGQFSLKPTAFIEALDVINKTPD